MKTAAIIRCGASMGKGKRCRTELGKVVIGDDHPAPAGYISDTIRSVDIVPARGISPNGWDGFDSPCHGDRFYERGVFKFNAQMAPGAGKPAPISLYCDGERIVTRDDVDLEGVDIEEGF